MTGVSLIMSLTIATSLCPLPHLDAQVDQRNDDHYAPNDLGEIRDLFERHKPPRILLSENRGILRP